MDSGAGELRTLMKRKWPRNIILNSVVVFSHLTLQQPGNAEIQSAAH